jgi:hypothetical protein
VPDFATAIERLLTRIHHWDEPRWRSALTTPPAADATRPPAGDPSEPMRGTADTRSQLVQGLVQRLADLGAEAENRPVRPVPHLHDLVLRDQLRVLAGDILAAAPGAELLDRAAAAVNEVRRSL